MTKQENSLPPLVQEALSQTSEPENKKHNCITCEGVGCVELNPDNIYTNDSLGLKLNVPAYVCSKCEGIVYEPKEYIGILEKEEAIQGRPYVKVEVKNGKINKYSIH